MMWSSTVCIVFLIVGSVSSMTSPALQNIDASGQEEESMDYALPSFNTRYNIPYIWNDVPRLYLYNNMMKQQETFQDPSRLKRKMPQLSISNPMEVLRQRLYLEIARKQMRENEALQAAKNRVFLENVGKRTYQGDTIDNNRFVH